MFIFSYGLIQLVLGIYVNENQIKKKKWFLKVKRLDYILAFNENMNKHN